MKISEIFYSVQGEGTLIGVPSVFVRTSGCNLRCVWCDTPYASWNPEGRMYVLDEIMDAVLATGSRHVVLTGGEPMIAPECVELTERFRTAGLHVTIETAGTVFEPVSCDLMSISPKLSNSTPLLREEGRFAEQHERIRKRPDVVRKLMDNYPYQLKFVVKDPSDLGEITELCDLLEADRSRVILMPEGTQVSVLKERGLWLTEMCKQEGFRYGPRLHIDLWGDKRGI